MPFFLNKVDLNYFKSQKAGDKTIELKKKQGHIGISISINNIHFVAKQYEPPTQYVHSSKQPCN